MNLTAKQVDVLFKLTDQVLTDDPEHWDMTVPEALALWRELSHARELAPGWTVEDEIKAKNRL